MCVHPGFHTHALAAHFPYARPTCFAQTLVRDMRVNPKRECLLPRSDPMSGFFGITKSALAKGKVKPTTNTLGRIPNAGDVCFLVGNLHDVGLE